MDTETTWIRGPKLRKRWDMPNSTFHDKRKKGLIPPPEYPFGPSTPYWRMSTILAHESAAQKKAVA